MNCKQGTEIIISQMVELLEKMDAGTYSKPLSLFNGSSIGQHFRHIVDFYGCLVRDAGGGRIDYAKRERDVRVETQPRYAAEVLTAFAGKISEMKEQNLLEVVADFSSDLNEERPVVTSTVARELMYAYDHAVHHLAMIKMGLKETRPELEVDQRIGVAPSTLKHWENKG
jgi:uncharacterized damage-inducible protein DinB